MEKPRSLHLEGRIKVWQIDVDVGRNQDVELPEQRNTAFGRLRSHRYPDFSNTSAAPAVEVFLGPAYEKTRTAPGDCDRHEPEMFEVQCFPFVFVVRSNETLD